MPVGVGRHVARIGLLGRCFERAEVIAVPFGAMHEIDVLQCLDCRFQLINLMDELGPAAEALRHVNLMHGTKWYGNHLGPFKTPAKETDPGHMPPNFYHDQQAFIVDRQKGKAWTWSSEIPHAICGFAIGNPMNLVMVLAVYAMIS